MRTACDAYSSYQSNQGPELRAPNTHAHTTHPQIYEPSDRRDSEQQPGTSSPAQQPPHPAGSSSDSGHRCLGTSTSSMAGQQPQPSAGQRAEKASKPRQDPTAREQPPSPPPPHIGVRTFPEGQILDIYFANYTAWSAWAQAHVAAHPASVHMGVEHHLQSTKLKDALQTWQKQGYRTTYSPAVSTGNAQGAAGGTWLVTRSEQPGEQTSMNTDIIGQLG